MSHCTLRLYFVLEAGYSTIDKLVAFTSAGGLLTLWQKESCLHTTGCVEINVITLWLHRSICKHLPELTLELVARGSMMEDKEMKAKHRL